MLNILHVYCTQLFALCSSIVPICSKFMSSVASCFQCFQPNISHFVRNCSTFPKIFGFVRKYLNISQFLANPRVWCLRGVVPKFIPDKFLGAKISMAIPKSSPFLWVLLCFNPSQSRYLFMPGRQAPITSIIYIPHI